MTTVTIELNETKAKIEKSLYDLGSVKTKEMTANTAARAIAHECHLAHGKLVHEQDVVTLQEDGEDELRSSHKSCTPRTKHEESCVLQVVNTRESHLELEVLDTGIVADVGEEERKQHEWYYTERDGD